MKLNKSYLLLCLFILANAAFGSADNSNGKKGYYMFPIMPGKNNFLAGTMGELRAAHFHGGIDIKTGGREGLSVYAAADGYVSRVKVTINGYGNALYITHPNGETTVYAHLLQFEKVIADWVRQNQYQSKSFTVDLWPEKNQFIFKQGEVVALSGNTGGSSGPHLHFEIRDANQRPLNPLHYNFPEIIDNIPPIIQKLALECLEPFARINGKYGRFEFKVYRKGTDYYLDKPIKVNGKVGIEILAHDKLNGASNKNGIPIVQMEVDEIKIYEQNLSSFSFAESRNILVHTNFRIKQNTGRSYNKLYIDDGDELGFYNRELGNGVINIQDDKLHPVKITLIDAYENESRLHFEMRGTPAGFDIINYNSGKRKKEGSTVFNNTMIITKNLSKDSSQLIEVYSERRKHVLQPKYIEDNYAVFIWDLTKGLPDSTDLCYKTEKYNFQVAVPSNYAFNYYNSHIDLYFPRRSLFDTLYLQLSHKVDSTINPREYFIIRPESSPIRQNIQITLKTKLDYPKKEQSHVYRVSGKNNFNFVGGKWKKNHISFKTRELGPYTILEDNLPPQIRVIKLNSNMTSFIVKDDLSGIATINAYINERWVLMNYDYKKNLIWSEKLNNDISYEGEFRLIVVDNAGNSKIFKTNL